MLAHASLSEHQFFFSGLYPSVNIPYQMVVWRQPLPSSLLRRPEAYFPFTIPLALVLLPCCPSATPGSGQLLYPCVPVPGYLYSQPSNLNSSGTTRLPLTALLPALDFCFLLPMLLTFQAKLEKSNSLWERKWVQNDSILSPWSWIWDFWYCPLTSGCKKILESWEKLNLPRSRKSCQGRTYNSSVKQKVIIHLTSKFLLKMTASPFRVDAVGHRACLLPAIGSSCHCIQVWA